MPCCLRLLAIRVAPSTSLMLSSSYVRREITRIRPQLNKLCCQGLQTAHIAISPPTINPNILPFGPPQALEFRRECCELSVCLRVGFTNKHQYADLPHLIRLLRAPRAATQPHRRAA